ncbi:MAG: T9SS type A sorting domain-containing protein [Clostridium sp.]|nr:T9SS type A sorting domain-containing protein [Clostridium sp.]
MKHFYTIMASAVFACTFAAHADSHKLVLGHPDGDKHINVSDIKQITFDGTQMTIATSQGNHQADVLSLSNIKFDMATSSAESISKDFEDGANIELSAGVLTVTVAGDGMAQVDVYAISGVKAASAAATGSVTVDLNSLSTGVYIIKANNKTIKFTR